MPMEKVPSTTMEPVPAGEDEDGKVYPQARKVAVVMLALYLSLFLISLVRLLSEQTKQALTLLPGPNNNRHCRPANNERLPLHQRHRLVR